MAVTREAVIAGSGAGAPTPLLMLTELYLPTKGGTAVWFDEVYRRLGGKEIHVLTADVPGASDHDEQHPNSVHRVRLRRHGWLSPESLAIYGTLLARGLGLVVRHRFQAVHAGRVLPEGLVGLLIARLARLPLLIYAHGEEITTWRQPGKLRAMQYVYRRADRVVANSEFTRGELVHLGVDPARITVLHPGVDLRRFRPGLPHEDLRQGIGLGREQPLILSVGRLSRRKGFDQTIKAVARLKAEGIDVHYAVIGIGPDRDYLDAVIREAGVGESIHMLGHVEQDDLPRWYCAADVFAMPNRSIDGDTEGFGMVFVEAAACSKPVLAGKDGGTGDAVLDGVTGWRVDGGSLDDVTAALRRLLLDARLRAAMGARAYDRVRGELSWEHVAKLTRELSVAMSQDRNCPGKERHAD